MKVDFYKQHQWEELNQVLQRSLNISQTVRSYFGLTHAVHETTRGLAKLFPHKRSIGLIKATSPYIQSLELHFSMEGYQVHSWDMSYYSSDKFLAELPQDLLFVIGALDDPMTGQVFDLQKHFSNLNSKRIFSIFISHSWHEVRELPKIENYTLGLLSLQKNLSVAVMGARSSKITPLLDGYKFWPSDFLTQINYSIKSKTENKNDVVHFEQSGIANSKPFFNPDATRLYDRAVLVFEDINAEAMFELLTQKLNLNIEELGGQIKIETLSSCRWGGFKTLGWYQEQGYSEEVCNSTLILDHQILNQETKKVIEESYKQIIKLQNG